jgi:ubiquinone biosynthesis protein
MIKVILMNIDIGQKLDPEFNFSSHVEPYLNQILRHRFFSRDSVRRASHTMIRTADDLIELPHHLNRSLQRLAEGSIRIELISPDIELIAISIDRAITKVIIGVLVAAIVLGSSVVIIAADIRMGADVCSIIPLLTLAGYILAVIVAILSIIHILRRPKKKY